MSSDSRSKLQKKQQGRTTAKRRLFEIENNDDDDKQTGNPKLLAVVDDGDDDVEVVGVKQTPASTSSSMIVDTPQKKGSSNNNKKQRTTTEVVTTTDSTQEEFRPFFSPKGRRFVTPEKEDEDDEDEKETPVKKKKKTTQKVLPMFEGLTTAPLSKKSSKKTKREESEYVPTYIHKNLSYQRKGKATLTEKCQKTFDFVSKHFIIPKNFETNKFDYGPQSGTCYEERVIQAYNLGLLEPININSAEEGSNNSDTVVVEFCSNCIQTGHMKNDCPSLI